ncbi:MAG: PilZ domain-containing protein [Gammaproteobacteria bacterium]|nr:PilZ domain-containing protein [Gammaproteobacteria bacterium]
MVTYAEKRDFLRMPLDCNLSFKAVDSGREFEGNLINLSRRGILFTSRENFEAGTLLSIVLRPSHTETLPIHATVMVARVSNNDALFEIACKIRNIAPQSAL